MGANTYLSFLLATLAETSPLVEQTEAERAFVKRRVSDLAATQRHAELVASLVPLSLAEAAAVLDPACVQAARHFLLERGALSEELVQSLGESCNAIRAFACAAAAKLRG